MFITLRQSSSHADMEQVVTRGAQQTSPFRRPACTFCQKKKLRCTGSGSDCDRCIARSVVCVFPQSNGKIKTRRPSIQKESVNKRLDCGGNKNKPELDKDTVSRKQLEKGHVSPPDPAVGERDVQDVNFYNDMTQPLVDIEEFSRNAQLDSSALSATIDYKLRDSDGLSNALHNLDDILQGLWNPQRGFFANKSKPPSAPIPDIPEFSLEPQYALPDLLNSGTPASLQPRPATQAGHSTGNGCLCIQNIVCLTQQFEDDDFNIRSLTLDQVVQLLKWAIAQCSKPLDCPDCQLLLTVPSVLLLICERLCAMFQCSSRRIQFLHQRLAGCNITPCIEKSVSGNILDPESAISCMSEGRVLCNVDLFSEEFQKQYSDEEQIHMIRALLRLQFRKFRALLIRLDGVMKVVGNETRQAKVRMVIQRLNKAATDIDNSLREVLEYF